ncbi:hypothetical protein GIB67_036742 [Kingdonia uniflora]|uniref:Uncharacterized protein n=1 Tax=Kingdonia uniflora TaxID=39325 RepID=A0A7J7LWK4_9MAGN|nr:hypothetical protein GIB67_036742 [Kingdonia uniflora]
MVLSFILSDYFVRGSVLLCCLCILLSETPAFVNPFKEHPNEIQAFCDLEPIYTYEGTYDINSLVTGREITGISSFKAAASTQHSRM